MAFQEHGDYKISSDGEIIYLITKGTWNVESADNCIGIINEYIKKISSGRFALVADTWELTGATPDVLNAWINAFKYWQTIGMGASSMIGDPNSVLYKIYLAEFDRVLSRNIDFKATRSFDESMTWLNELGYDGFSSYPQDN